MLNSKWNESYSFLQYSRIQDFYNNVRTYVSLYHILHIFTYPKIHLPRKTLDVWCLIIKHMKKHVLESSYNIGISTPVFIMIIKITLCNKKSVVIFNPSKFFCRWDIFGQIYNLKEDIMSRKMLVYYITHVVTIIFYHLALNYVYLRSLIFLRTLDFDTALYTIP